MWQSPESKEIATPVCVLARNDNCYIGVAYEKEK